MGEEKILGGAEKRVENQINQEKDNSGEKSLEKFDASLEQSEAVAEEKVKQAEDQIVTSATTVNDEEKAVVEEKVKDVAGLDNIEDQINKLTEIAVQNSPKMALKVARSLNSNYVLDEMHDRLINEEELREILINKGLIEKI